MDLVWFSRRAKILEYLISSLLKMGDFFLCDDAIELCLLKLASSVIADLVRL
jgi:hypothetical protein